MQTRTGRQRRADASNLQKAHQAKAARRISITCRGCSAEFSVPPSVAARGKKYCSWGCRAKGMRGGNGANAGGGGWMRGRGNPNWKGGKKRQGGRPEYTKECNQWRRAVYARDNYTCQECGFARTKPGQLNAHHIKSWAKYPEGRFDVGNGTTLCKPCHRERHN